MQSVNVLYYAGIEESILISHTSPLIDLLDVFGMAIACDYV